MTHPSNRYEPLTPVRHEKTAQVTDSEVNEALESGNVEAGQLDNRKIEHDEGAPPYADRNDTPRDADNLEHE